MDKPSISAEAFSSLILRVGTVLSTRAHPELPGLSVVEVHLDHRVQALTPASGVRTDLTGHQVVVAGPLTPLSIGSECFRHSLLTDGSVPATVLVVTNEVPDGSRLY